MHTKNRFWVLFGRLMILVALLYFGFEFYKDLKKVNLIDIDERSRRVGSDSSMGLPANEDWLKDGGIYLVKWSLSEEGAERTNNYIVAQYVGTSLASSSPEQFGTNTLFVLTSHLEAGHFYLIDKSSGQTKYRIVR